MDSTLPISDLYQQIGVVTIGRAFYPVAVLIFSGIGIVCVSAARPYARRFTLAVAQEANGLSQLPNAGRKGESP
jgi:hypothetical protein